MPQSSVSYSDLDPLADGERWPELLRLAGDPDAATVEERREVAHVVASEAPAAFGAAALALFPEDYGWPGPLWEVVAERPWSELRSHLTDPRTRHLVAHTRVLRGEDLRWDAELDPAVLGAPPWLLPWEAAWSGGLDVPCYWRTGSGGTVGWSFPQRLPDPVPVSGAVTRPARRDVPPELAASSGAADAYAFQGTAWQAVATVASDRAGVRGADVAFEDAYPSLVHLATGLTAYGSLDGQEQRFSCSTGQALGRKSLWRALSAMAGSARPADVERVTAFVQRLRCVGWQEPDDRLYFVHLAMEDPEQSTTWVLHGSSND